MAHVKRIRNGLLRPKSQFTKGCTMTLTKENILDGISDLDAYGAIEELSGMLSRSIEEGRPKDIKPIMEAMRSIERDLEIWADLEEKKAKAQ